MRKRRRLVLAAALTLTAAASAMIAGSSASAASAGSSASAATTAVQPPPARPTNHLLAKRPLGVRSEIQQVLDSAEKKLVALASAVPPEKFGWRPGAGVRSFGEVCVHVAAGNYELGNFWGMKPPPNLDLAKIEQQGADKGNAVAAMRVSFQRVRESLAAMTDADLDREIDLFGQPGTVRLALLHAVAHAHEHLGQLIAYARMNGIVPPWSLRPENK